MRIDNPNPVIKRIAVKAECVFASPALIGSGNDENTDSDILRDNENEPFLPGSTVAGVLLCSLRADVEPLFGQQDNISPLWVFDAELTGASVIELDGVALDRENKVAIEQKKYDFEAIATGTKFTVRLLLTIRQNDVDLETPLKKVLGALKSGEMAFGAKTKRGFGRVECSSVLKREFELTPGNTNSLNEWIQFDWYNAEGWSEAETEGYTTGSSVLKAELKLDGGVMIRDTRNIYENLRQGEKAPDYKHMSVNGDPIILGPSWAGAFRSGLTRLLKQKYPDKIDAYLDKVFGFVTEDNKAAAVSRVTFMPSLLKTEGSPTEGYRNLARVKIDRFTGGAAYGALFNEKPWFGGGTVLEIRYPSDSEDIKELLLLALDGLNNGLIQLGGETSIGRGFFKVLSINGEEAETVIKKPKNNLIAEIQKAGESE